MRWIEQILPNFCALDDEVAGVGQFHPAERMLPKSPRLVPRGELAINHRDFKAKQRTAQSSASRLSGLVNRLIQNWRQHLGLRIRLAHETEIVRMRTVHGAFAVAAEEVRAFEVVKVFHTGFAEAIVSSLQRGAAGFV